MLLSQQVFVEDLGDVHPSSPSPRHEAQRDERRFTFTLNEEEDAHHHPEKVYIKVTSPVPKITLDAVDDGKCI